MRDYSNHTKMPWSLGWRPIRQITRQNDHDRNPLGRDDAMTTCWHVGWPIFGSMFRKGRGIAEANYKRSVQRSNYGRGNQFGSWPQGFSPILCPSITELFPVKKTICVKSNNLWTMNMTLCLEKHTPPCKYMSGEVTGGSPWTVGHEPSCCCTLDEHTTCIRGRIIGKKDGGPFS